MPSAAEVCSRLDLNRQAKACLRPEMRPRDFVGALVATKQHVSAIDFMAHFLPVRESVWWGCLCLQHASDGNYSEADKAAAKAVVEWIMRPEDAVRAAAKGPADVAGLGSVAGSLAMAVYQTGGNVAPPKTPPTAPSPYAWAKSVARAVKLASTNAGAGVIEIQRAYVFLAANIAQESAWFER